MTSSTISNDESELTVSELPQVRNRFRMNLALYQGFWFTTNLVPRIIRFQRNFEVNDQDIVIASKPKSGTTWLKALLFSVVNRSRYTPSNSPLLFTNPHKLAPFFELDLFVDPVNDPDLTRIESPRLFSTHLPYQVLPETIKSSSSKCRIVYVCRNPLDTLVSQWHFVSRQNDVSVVDPAWTMEDEVNGFCRGEDVFGPFWDNVLGFWKASRDRPDKVLFLKYEDMKEDIEGVVKRLAEFVGVPFSGEEEREGVVRGICQLCSFESLKDIQAKNKPESASPHVKNESFFRNGVVGDWVNELSPEMVERLRKVVQEKLKGSGLEFKTT